MTQHADRVHTDSAEIQRLAGLIQALPDEGWVELVFTDGSRASGIVTTRPTLQTFIDAQGSEGINAILRFDDPQVEGRSRYVWVDHIARIRPIHSDQRPFAR